MERTKDKNLRLILAISRRLVGTMAWLESEALLGLLQDYMLALQVARLEGRAKGAKPNPALDDEIEQAKKAIDAHIAKRLGQLPDKDDKEYIG